jgi:hypothetical protein
MNHCPETMLAHNASIADAGTRFSLNSNSFSFLFFFLIESCESMKKKKGGGGCWAVISDESAEVVKDYILNFRSGAASTSTLVGIRLESVWEHVFGHSCLVTPWEINENKRILG